MLCINLILYKIAPETAIGLPEEIKQLAIHLLATLENATDIPSAVLAKIRPTTQCQKNLVERKNPYTPTSTPTSTSQFQPTEISTQIAIVEKNKKQQQKQTATTQPSSATFR